jgi:hypothetical protein
MSDFDAALERLLTDPGFARALAADPGSALAGYRLSSEELAVLTTQLAEEAGGAHRVEPRTNQSSLAGLLIPLTSTGGGLLGSDPATPTERGLGAAPQRDLGPAPEAGLGTAPEAGLGKAPEPPPGTVETSLAGAARGRGIGPAPALPDGYQTRVDVDGDGAWDRHTLRATPTGEVEIRVDQDRDGRPDFVGHDQDADGLVDWSEYDRDRDGRFETRMYDDDGDGWMDRTETGGHG